MVRNRQKWANKLVGTARNHRYRVKVGMAELLGADHAGAAAELMEASADRLETATLTMIATDETHSAELDEDATMRVECAESAVAIRSVLMGLRDRAATLFGADYARALGYVGSTPEDPEALCHLATRILERIDELDRPPCKIEGMGFDAGAWKRMISRCLTKLQGALEVLATRAHTAEQTIAAKHRAIAAYDAVFFKSATLISALLSIAGEEELARQVHGLIHIPGGGTDEAEGDPFDDSRDTVPSSIPVYPHRLPKWLRM
jgi:hypothetical protein